MKKNIYTLAIALLMIVSCSDNISELEEMNQVSDKLLSTQKEKSNNSLKESIEKLGKHSEELSYPWRKNIEDGLIDRRSTDESRAEKTTTITIKRNSVNLILVDVPSDRQNVN